MRRPNKLHMEKKSIGKALASNSGSYLARISTGTHTLVADEPLIYGGQDRGPSPADYLCTALASCKAITMRMYAERKGWAVETIEVEACLERGADLPSGQNTFRCFIRLQGGLTEAQRERLLEIARACPVERLLGKPSAVLTELC